MKMNTKFLKETIGKKLRSTKTSFITQKFFGSASHSYDSGFNSDSGSEHHHDHIHHRDFYEERVVTEPWTTFHHIKNDKFDVLNLIEKLREPVQQKASDVTKEAPKNISEVHSEYINFLAQSFQNTVLNKYPEYRDQVDDLKKTIPGFDRMNAYQQEVQLLDAYMIGLIKANREESLTLQTKQGCDHLSKEEYELEQISHRVELLGKLTVENESDTRILKTIKKKLKKVLESDKKYAQFLVDYSKELESKVLQKVVQKKNMGYSEENSILNKELNDLKSPLNPFYHPQSVVPHDNIQIDNWNMRTDRIENERYKYLSLYDLVLDQHLRRVRPENLDDNISLYSTTEKNTDQFERNQDKDIRENVYFDYTCRNYGEFYTKFINEVNRAVGKREFHNENRPIGKQWEDEHKYPHVADRLGWEVLAETTLDKNPFFERILSVPIYQWQPFIQTPSLNPDPSLDLEIGETIYEDKWAFEWTLLLKLLFLVIPIGIAIQTIQYYDYNMLGSTDYRVKYSPTVAVYNVAWLSQHDNRIEKLNYWGTDMWYIQHWIRKFAGYTLLPCVLYSFLLLVRRFGHGTVLKASFNRSKDAVFVTIPGHFLGKKTVVCELHYLEQHMSSMATSWKYNPLLNGNIEGGKYSIEDLRTGNIYSFKSNPKYWNHDVKPHFDNNTTTYWKGQASKDVNRGIIFNNSIFNSQDELEIINKVEEELKDAIIKYGPIQKQDYETGFKYQLNKRLNENRVNLISGISH